MIELEKTYLIKYLPEGFENLICKEVLDIYLPISSDHPSLRIRKNATKYEITKKVPVTEGDASVQTENTIPLSPKEYEEIATVLGKRVEKWRYIYTKDTTTFEIDVFKGTLDGLVLVDVEFENVDMKNNFVMPDFCLADVTQELFIAGGMLAGKSYRDVESELNKFGYTKLISNIK